jgi:hypothetical protein
MTSKGPSGIQPHRTAELDQVAASAHGRFWHECDLRAAPTNVRSWESNGLKADVAFYHSFGEFAARPTAARFSI